MELVQWFFMGILFTLMVQAIAWLSLKVRMPWYGWTGMILGCLMILFGIGWAGASYLEGVSQSGSMGLMFFSLPGVLLIVIVWRYLVPKDSALF